VTLPFILARLRELPCLRGPFTAANRCDAPTSRSEAGSCVTRRVLAPADPRESFELQRSHRASSARQPFQSGRRCSPYCVNA
jgi:hypothetical protein